MQSVFILDTNVLLRFLVADNQKQFIQAKDLLRQAENGKIQLIVEPVVIAETCFVLEHYYKKSLDQIAETMQVFLSVDWLLIEHKIALRGLWEFYVQRMHFVDSYLLAMAKFEGIATFSFDQKLSKKLKQYE